MSTTSSEHRLAPPRPVPTPITEPFWQALTEHRVVIQRCGACTAWVHYPRIRCPHCGSADLAFAEVGPSGVIHTFTIARQPTAPHFVDEVPQVIAMVELGIGVRVTTTLVDADLDSLHVGQRVEPVFDDGDDGITLLRYRPVDD